MSDPVADMMLEAEQDAEAERISRQNVEERLASVERQLTELVGLLRTLTSMEGAEHNGVRIITVTERDENERVKTIKVS